MIDIISFWSAKGGVGKTTLALSVASALGSLGYKVIVADLDLQRSSIAFGAYAEKKGNDLPYLITDGLPGRTGKAEFLIVDHAPTHAPVARANLIVMPFCPGPLDFWAVQAGRKRAGNVKTLEVLNRVNKSREIDRELIAEFEIVIADRSIYRRIMAEGKTLQHSGIIEKLYGARKAKKEIDKLTNAILTKCNYI